MHQACRLDTASSLTLASTAARTVLRTQRSGETSGTAFKLASVEVGANAPCKTHTRKNVVTTRLFFFAFFSLVATSNRQIRHRNRLLGHAGLYLVDRIAAFTVLRAHTYIYISCSVGVTECVVTACNGLQEDTLCEHSGTPTPSIS